MSKGSVRHANGRVVPLDMVWLATDIATDSLIVRARWNECHYSSAPMSTTEAYTLRDVVMDGGLFDEQLRPLDEQ